MNGLALCAGVGGLELGLKLALGDAYRTVGYVEREAYCAAVLVARMEEATLDQAPIWDDLTTFDGEPWRGVVDIVSAGFPCQPFSVAGQRRCVEDSRWIWGEVARIVRDVEPEFVFLENVPGLLIHGLGHVLGDLASLGFDAEWGCVSACAFGAPHPRRRVFILAHSRRHRPHGIEHRWCPGQDWKGTPNLERTRETGWWASKSPSLGMADGVTSRVDRLRACGNGVVPLVAAWAFRVLVNRSIPGGKTMRLTRFSEEEKA